MGRKVPSNSVGPRCGPTLDEALLREPFELDVRRALAVDVDLRVDLKEDVVGELLAHRGEEIRYMWVLVEEPPVTTPDRLYSGKNWRSLVRNRSI